MEERWFMCEYFLMDRDLLDLDVFSRSDPMCVVYHQVQGTSNCWAELLRTEVIWDCLNPDFTTKVRNCIFSPICFHLCCSLARAIIERHIACIAFTSIHFFCRKECERKWRVFLENNLCLYRVWIEHDGSKNFHCDWRMVATIESFLLVWELSC